MCYTGVWELLRYSLETETPFEGMRRRWRVVTGCNLLLVLHLALIDDAY